MWKLGRFRFQVCNTKYIISSKAIILIINHWNHYYFTCVWNDNKAVHFVGRKQTKEHFVALFVDIEPPYS